MVGNSVGNAVVDSVVQTRVFAIRPAVPDDAADVCDVLCRSITESCAPDHRNDPATLKAWLGNKNPATVTGWFTSPANHALVAERDGQLVGVALLTQAGKLALCYVLPEAQRLGIGKALVEGLEAQGRAWGISKVRLHATSSSSGFFARRGYHSAGMEPSCFGLECELLWKKLDEGDCPPGERKRFCNCG